MNRNAMARLEELEAKARRQRQHSMVAGVAAVYGFDPGDLIAEAERIQEMLDDYGFDHTVTMLAETQGITPGRLMAEIQGMVA